MKIMKIFFVMALCLSLTIAQNKNQPKEKAPAAFQIKTQSDSVSYAIGQNILRSLKDPNLNVNFDVLIKSMKDGMSGKPLMNDEAVMKCLTDLNKRMQAKMQAQQKEQEEKRKIELAPIIAKNKKEGEAFLEQNEKKEGVKVTDSGLQYKVLVVGPGTGPTPKDTSTVKVHYKGTLLDGKEFDSSFKRNEPTEFPLNRVIKGWTEGIQLMHVGDKFEFYIPYNLAYGEEGRGETIPPASVLIFEVELLEIKK